MQPTSKFKYHLLTDDPLLRVIFLFSVLGFIASFCVTLMHAANYGVFESNIGFIGVPITIFTLTFGFYDCIETCKDGSKLYTKVNLFIFKSTVVFTSLELIKDNNYSALVIKNDTMTRQTRMIYQNSLAKSYLTILSK